MSKKQVRVLIEVSGGVVQQVHCDDSVYYEVLDWDNLLGDMWSSGDTERQLGQLPEWVLTYIQDEYPKDWLKIQERIETDRVALQSGMTGLHGA